jgi:hypothetical protein
MSYTRISSITLYVVAVISLVVILFFYVGPRTVDIDELDARVEQLLTEGVIVDPVVDEAPAEVDSTAMDSTAMASDSTEAAMSAASDDDLMETAEVVPGEIDLRDHLSGWELMVYKRTDYALRWAYILLAIAAIAAVVFPLINIVTDVKAILRLLAVLGGAAVLLLLSYFVFADSTAIDILGYTGTDNSDPGTLKWIGTGLYSTYIIFGVALISILYSEVANLFK